MPYWVKSYSQRNKVIAARLHKKRLGSQFESCHKQMVAQIAAQVHQERSNRITAQQMAHIHAYKSESGEICASSLQDRGTFAGIEPCSDVGNWNPGIWY